jgi:hypothetical protein
LEAQRPRLDRALLAPQQAPDCGLTGANLQAPDGHRCAGARFGRRLRASKISQKLARRYSITATAADAGTIFNDKSVTAKLRMPSPDSHFFAPLDQHPAGAVKNM